MGTPETIYELVKTLPPDQAAEVLNFVEGRSILSALSEQPGREI